MTAPDLSHATLSSSNIISDNGYDDLVAMHDVAARFYQGQLPGSWAQDYLRHRGFSDDVQELWRAGYAPASWDALLRHLRQAGYQDPLIVAAGLARRTRHGTLIDTFRDRVVFPVRSPGGRIIAFTGRAGDHADAGVPKYLNSPNTVLYSKNSTLFGLAEAKPALGAGAVPVLAEGPLDVIAIATAAPGRYAPVAPCGTSLTGRHVAALDDVCDLARAGALVAFDADVAGRRAAVSAYRVFSPLTGRVGAVIFPPGSDPAQVLNEYGPGALAQVLAERRLPLADLVVNAGFVMWKRWLPYAEGRVGALRAIAPVIASMPPSDVARQVSRLSARLGFDHVTVTEAVTDALTGRFAGSDTYRRQETRPVQRAVRARDVGQHDFPAGSVLGCGSGPATVASPAGAGRAVPAERTGLAARRVAG